MTRRLIPLLALLLAVTSAAGQVTAKQCASIEAAPPKPNKILPVVHLTDLQMEQIHMSRACLRGYMYPGGEDALLQASSSEIRDDLMHLKELFDKRSSLNIASLSKNDKLRVVKMELGWDREQVLLWGNWAYLRQLDQEEDFKTVVTEVQRIRSEFGLNVVPLKTWDDADEGTYFAPQTLRNMIVAFEYNAKGHLITGTVARRQTLVKSYLTDEPALIPTMSFTGNPGEAVLGPVCRTQAKTSQQ